MQLADVSTKHPKSFTLCWLPASVPNTAAKIPAELHYAIMYMHGHMWVVGSGTVMQDGVGNHQTSQLEAMFHKCVCHTCSDRQLQVQPPGTGHTCCTSACQSLGLVRRRLDVRSLPWDRWHTPPTQQQAPGTRSQLLLILSTGRGTAQRRYLHTQHLTKGRQRVSG
jgi:hypothetical protein